MGNNINKIPFSFKQILFLIEKEIKIAITTVRFKLLTFFLAILFALSIFIGYGDFSIRFANYQLEKTNVNVWEPIIEPTPLSILYKGLDDKIAQHFRFTFGGYIIPGLQQPLINRLFAFFSMPDFLFIINVVTSLLAILLSYDALCGEKEDGTLKLLSTYNLSRLQLALGTLLGRWLIILAPFTFFFLVSITVLFFLPDVQLGLLEISKIFLTYIGACLLILVFCLLGLLVSALTYNRPASLALSLVIWVFFVFVLPNTSLVLAETLINTHSPNHLSQANLHSTYQHFQNRFKEESEAQNLSQRREIYLRWIDNLGKSYEANRISYQSEINNLISSSRMLSSISPVALFTYLATDLCNTGLYEEKKVIEAIKLHLKLHFKKINNQLLSNRYAEIFPQNEHAEEPSEFHFVRSSLSEIFWPSGLFQLLMIFLFTLVLTMSIVIVFYKYDVR